MVKNYQNPKQNSWMAKGPGRCHSQTTHAAKLHWNTAKRSRVIDTRIVPLCRRKRLPWFRGPKYSKIPQPTCWLGPGFPVLSAEHYYYYYYYYYIKLYKKHKKVWENKQLAHAQITYNVWYVSYSEIVTQMSQAIPIIMHSYTLSNLIGSIR